jgi:hypothetical protein
MKTVTRRIAKLEDQFGTAQGKPQYLIVVSRAVRELALDEDRCIQILRESGFLPTGPFGLVNLWQIPEGLNAEELERYLREHGAETRGSSDAQNSDEPAGAGLRAAL